MKHQILISGSKNIDLIYGCIEQCAAVRHIDEGHSVNLNNANFYPLCTNVAKRQIIESSIIYSHDNFNQSEGFYKMDQFLNARVDHMFISS